ncbi:MAG: response regulator [Treponema sp.]|jgi:CheY-like chemotaxis protein/HPt (histidine-containing phosphotransfer) domain-containing protein|nr:response regulator [Treponema sp.]
MVNRERLQEISEISLAGIQKMDESKFEAYVLALNSFIEGLPDQEEKMKTAMEAKDYPSLAKAFADVRDLLEAIHAGYMADECTKQIKELKKVKHEKLEVFMTYFLTSLSMLSIDIQMAELKEDGSPPDEKSLKNKGKTKEQKIILAVDDTAFFLTTLKTVLQDTDYKLYCVTSGEDAIRFFEKHRADLLLLDIEMPDMNGYELAENLRKNGQKAPIIFLTGNSRKENVVKAVEAGAADFIVKPVNKKEVLDKIGRHI